VTSNTYGQPRASGVTEQVIGDWLRAGPGRRDKVILATKQAQEAARAFGMSGLVSEQSLYNLAARTVELEVLPACQGYGLGVLPWSPLHGGLPGGVLRKETAAGGRRPGAGRPRSCRRCVHR
jgi:aryl-alcohol dehydrogenase-like predicted oxidoreductase